MTESLVRSRLLFLKLESSAFGIVFGLWLLYLVCRVGVAAM